MSLCSIHFILISPYRVVDIYHDVTVFPWGKVKNNVLSLANRCLISESQNFEMCRLLYMTTNTKRYIHDNVIKWKHFPRYWTFVWGIHRSSVNYPYKGQWRGAWMFSLIYAWTNDWVNNRDAGDLRRRLTHYDVSLILKYCMIIIALACMAFRFDQILSRCSIKSSNYFSYVIWF